MLNDQPFSFKSCEFFQECAGDLRKIAQESRLNQRIHKQLKKMQNHEKEPEDSSQEHIQLMNNIVVDYLRSHNHNYSYSVFIRQTEIKSEEIVNKKMLSALLNIQEQMDKTNIFNMPVLLPLITKLEQNYKKKNREDRGVQVQIIKDLSDLSKNTTIVENRVREVREEVEKREKKFYEQRLQSFKTVELLNLKQQVEKSISDQYKSKNKKLEKQYEKLTHKLKEAMTNQRSDLALQNAKNIQALKLQKDECRKLKEENKQMLHFKLSHRCQQSAQYKELQRKLKGQRKQIETKKRQLELAIKNVNTKVEVLMMQKNKILGEQKASDQFSEQKKVYKANKDHMIDTIYGQMKKAIKKSQIVSDENLILRKTITQLKQTLKSRETIQQSQKQNDNPCSQCQKAQIRGKFKLEQKHVMTNVTENDFEHQSLAEKEEVSEWSLDIGEEYEHYQRVNELEYEMKVIKKKIKLLSSDLI